MDADELPKEAVAFDDGGEVDLLALHRGDSLFDQQVRGKGEAVGNQSFE